VHDTYLVKLKEPCFDLRNALTVGLRTYSGVVRDFDSVIVASPPSMRQTCMIEQILQVSNETQHPVVSR